MDQLKSRDFESNAEFQAEYALAKELPYWDFFNPAEGNCVALSDGTLVQGVRLKGISVETFDADAVNRLTLQLRAFLNSLADGIDLQILVESNSDYSSVVNAHEKLKGNDPLISWIADGRIQTLLKAIESNLLQKLNLYLFLYGRIKSVESGLKSFFSKPKQFEQIRKAEFETRVKELGQAVSSVSSNLQTVGIQTLPLDSDEIRSLVYKTLNPTRSENISAPKPSTEHRTQEFLPEEIAIVPELSLSSPREQLVFSDLIQTSDAFFLDGLYHRLLTLKTLPEFTHSGLISKLLSLPFHFILSVQIKVPEQSKELSSLQTKRRMAHSMSMSHGGRATDLESEARLQSTEELLRELMNTGQKVFYFQTAILLRDSTREKLDLMTKTVLSKFREMNGAEAISETVAGFKVFKTILPAGNTTMVRAKRVKTDNLADFLPVYESHEGSKKPVCLFQNRMGGLVGYDPFDPTLPNYNCLVTGSSGAGKSFLNNCILLQYLTQSPIISIIDIGGSYRKLCEFLSGQYIEISPAKDGAATNAINPFLLPQGAIEPSPQKIKFLISLFETIFTDEEGDKLPKLDKSLLEEAIIKTYANSLPKMPKLSDFSKVLEESPQVSLKNFSKMLYSWTGNRPYGRLLDADNALDLNADMVVFDLKGLSSYPDLQSAMLLIITDFILGKIESVPGRRKQILMDECWELLKSRGASQFMEYCVRTLRKSGSGITFITQGLEEIERSPIGPAILNNTATKFILMQRGDLEPIRKILKLNDQEMGLITSLRQEKGVFSEAFLIMNEVRVIVRIFPTAVEYWVATSDAADNALLENVRCELNKALPQIIHYLAGKYPKGSQGVTILTREAV